MYELEWLKCFDELYLKKLYPNFNTIIWMITIKLQVESCTNTIVVYAHKTALLMARNVF